MKRQSTCQRPGAQDPVFRRCIRLLPALARRRAAPLDALAVAYNAAFISANIERANIAHTRFPRMPFAFSPRWVLRRFSFAEIASICEDIISNAEVERGINRNYKEAVM